MDQEKIPEKEVEEYKKIVHKMIDETNEITVLVKIYTTLKYLK